MDVVTLIPQFGNLLFTLIAFVVALSVIVFVHEFGHYIVGRWSGIHAEVFSVGFGPALWSTEDKRGTRWQVAALPFGGYVRFAGDANAASAPDQEAMAQAVLNEEEYRKTMHGAPLWARAATVAAGPVFNFIMSIAVFAAIFMSEGRTADPLAVGRLLSLPDAGYDLRVGDEVLAVEGILVPSEDDDATPYDFNALIDALPVQPILSFTVRRDGEEVQVPGPYLRPAYVGQVVPRSAAMDAGMREGDVITA
ncbi:MAG: site-2 protease family protein, partial [Rhodobacteraceae bacterium]|nr:site-2 protease family protein [Paracoccaceae bacterium]